jgi:hypothetical protein
LVARLAGRSGLPDPKKAPSLDQRRGFLLSGYISCRLDGHLAREPLNIVLAKQHAAVECLSGDAQSTGSNKAKDAQG